MREWGKEGAWGGGAQKKHFCRQSFDKIYDRNRTDVHLAYPIINFYTDLQ